MKRTALFLAALLALSAFSCGESAGGADTTAPADDSTTPAVTEPAYELPKADFGGRDVNFYLSSNRSIMAVTEENGDTINDAVFRRNSKVEDLYNVNFKYTVGSDAVKDFPAWYSSAEASIMAGDNSIDIMGGYFYRLAAISATSDLFMNLNGLPEIDFSQDWWIGNLQEAASIGSKLYITAGNIDPAFYNRIYVMIFNKDLMESLGGGDIYKTVNDGKWTFEKLKELAKLGTSDLDGNSKMDGKDQYGLFTGKDLTVDPYNNAFELSYVKINASGEPELLGLSEKTVNAIAGVKEFLRDSGNAFYGEDGTKDPMFAEGRALLMNLSLSNLQTMRDSDTDFGIIPYPKWDEAQENYVTTCATDPVAGYLAPKTADSKLIGCLLEALAYYGWEEVYPEYYERALKGKNTRDDESAAMLDLIFSNIKFNFCQVYSYAFGDQRAPTMLMRMTIKNNKELASTYAADEALYKETLQKLTDALK